MPSTSLCVVYLFCSRPCSSVGRQCRTMRLWKSTDPKRPACPTRFWIAKTPYNFLSGCCSRIALWLRTKKSARRWIRRHPRERQARCRSLLRAQLDEDYSECRCLQRALDRLFRKVYFRLYLIERQKDLVALWSHQDWWVNPGDLEPIFRLQRHALAELKCWWGLNYWRSL